MVEVPHEGGSSLLRYMGTGPLEKEMAIHSSILAWEIPWTEEPGGLQSMGSQRVGHDLRAKQQQNYGSVFFSFRRLLSS